MAVLALEVNLILVLACKACCLDAVSVDKDVGVWIAWQAEIERAIRIEFRRACIHALY